MTKSKIVVLGVGILLFVAAMVGVGIYVGFNFPPRPLYLSQVTSIDIDTNNDGKYESTVNISSIDNYYLSPNDDTAIVKVKGDAKDFPLP